MDLFTIYVFGIIGIIFFVTGIIILVIGLCKHKLSFIVGGLFAILKALIFLFFCGYCYFMYDLTTMLDKA